MKKWICYLHLFTLLLIPVIGFSFNLTVTPTPESCTGNGALAFSSTNTDPTGTIVYEVYLLPNTAIPIATVITATLNGLSAGNYRIIAKETVGTAVTTQQQDVTINHTTVPLIFTIQTLNQACSTNSNITVNVTSGVGVSYEIFSGPLTFPLQTSPTFSGLPVGVYRIRVFDSCGTGVVSTFTVTLNPTGLTVNPPVFSNTTPPSCTSTVVTHTISSASGTIIGYPLTIHYTVHPPGGGAPVVLNSVVGNGNLTSENVSETIPYYLNQNYDYDMSITDACGSVFNNNFIVNQNITLLATIFPLGCDKNYFKLDATNFTPPYTLTFTTVPAGFTPSNFNSTYPGPYSTNSLQFGDASNPVPLGSYEVVITDFCGRTTTSPFTIISVPPVPSATGVNKGCLFNSGTITIIIPNYFVTTAIITAAPPAYPFALPHDVSTNVDPVTGTVTIDNIPLGNYTVALNDQCFDVLGSVNVLVPPYTDQGMNSDERPGCDLQKSSVRIGSNNAALTSITITSAPPAFSQTLPYNGNTNIATDGNFYMNNLPSGTYTFNGVDVCGFNNTISVPIHGYNITNSTFSLQANCGSFDIPLDFTSNGTANEAYCLQKLIDPVAGTWGNPSDNTIYPSGSVPNPSNSFSLNNHTTNLNLSFNGTFRIVRSFQTYVNGSEFNAGTVTAVDKDCIEILSPTLSFNQVLQIVQANRIPCSSSGTPDIIITANGTLPLHYVIDSKDGLPFTLDNGTSSIFQNLAAGFYTYTVQDVCGNIAPGSFDVSTLLSLVTVTQPGDVVTCNAQLTGNELFDLTPQTAVILGSQNPANYTVTYFDSLSNAQSNSNAIANLATYNAPNNPQTIYARIVYNPIPNCYETTSFDLIAGQNPSVILSPGYQSCSSNPITIDASTNNLPTTTYLWSDGTTNPIITISQLGQTTLKVTASNAYGSNNHQCSSPPTATEVTISELPVINHIDTTDWTDQENTITIFTSNNGSFEYSLDNLYFQEQNTFTNLLPGLYTVYVKDKFGCGVAQKEVWLLNYPKYFTPNDDGYHDTWKIDYSSFEPHFKVFIYDRFGKLLSYFDSKSQGWDGMYNGYQAVSTDYWFVVYREDRRILKGHFSLKR